MMNEIQKLEIERDNLREETENCDISIWKFWQPKKDRILLRKLERICQINDILSGVGLQKEFTKQEEEDVQE